MAHRYFKLVATREGKEDWVTREFLEGRARYGWSPPGTDLRVVRSGVKPWAEWPDDIRWAWSPSQFLINRIEVGHRIVLQARQPIREFLIGEVVEPGYSFDGSQDDFNHILHIRPLVQAPIPVNSAYVPEFLKHDLSKRGRYYEIYPERSIQRLDDLVERAARMDLDLGAKRSDGDAYDEAREEARRGLARVISDTWRAKDFEGFCEKLLRSLPNVEIKEASDTFKGWDMLVRFLNPITGEVLVDGVPVQCKNYSGAVDTDLPINDLVRAIENSGSSHAMLMIMGTLTDAFQKRLLERAAELSADQGREIVFEVIGEDRIAELYMMSFAED